MSYLFALKNIFREVFDDDALDITPETNKDELEGWDSVAQVKLVLALEEKYQVHFTMEEVSEIKMVQDFLDALQRHLGV